MWGGDAEGAAADGRSTASHSPPRDRFRAESHVYLLVKGKRETTEGGKRERKQGTDSNSNTRARRHSPLERKPAPARRVRPRTKLPVQVQFRSVAASAWHGTLGSRSSPPVALLFFAGRGGVVVVGALL